MIVSNNQRVPFEAKNQLHVISKVQRVLPLDPKRADSFSFDGVEKETHLH